MPASPSTTRPPSSRPELGACFHHVHLSALSASLVMGRGLDRAAAGISRLQSSCPSLSAFLNLWHSPAAPAAPAAASSHTGHCLQAEFRLWVPVMDSTLG